MVQSQPLAFITTRVAKHIESLRQRLSVEDQALLDNMLVAGELQHLFAISEYVVERCMSQPAFLLDQIKDKSLFQKLSPEQLAEKMMLAINGVNDEAALMEVLRHFRHRQMIRILWQEVNSYITIEKAMLDLSSLAECCIDSALQWLYNSMQLQFGTPYADGMAQRMVVLGMGKLGGRELNFSSDVDLIFCYPKAGFTRGGEKTVENQWFFNRLGQALIRVLDQITEEGFVYRMDLRLRPYGNSGALVWSFSAMEQYYQDQGRDWERYALIKARPVAGDKIQGFALLSMLQPFIYRRYLDFSAIEALRDMKELIRREVLQKGMDKDIKRGAGGIREIEFIAQGFQLIYGGKRRKIQSVSLLQVLANLAPMKFLSLEEARLLKQAYLFLRRFEHLLQVWEDKQTHNIPQDKYQQSVLAYGMGYKSWENLSEEISRVRIQVERLFSSLMTEPDSSAEKEGKWQLLWQKKIKDDECMQMLKCHNFLQAEEVYKQLVLLRDGKALKSVSHRSLSRVNRFIPALLYACESQNHPDQALLRTLPIVNKVLRRTSYLLLLLERPESLLHLVKLCNDSLWVAVEITKYPSLMDEFLNPGDLYNPPPREQLQNELSQQLSHIPVEDIETRLESLCYFKVAHLMKSVIAQTNGCMPLMMVSNYLTWVAETIIKEVWLMAWALITKKYGLPEVGNSQDFTPFIILGYGKLGGLEMGPSSDLDLVFIHDTDIQGSTQGKHSIDHQAFFARFAQKVIHLLSTLTPLGKLYEVDVRLRPSGNSGLLVSSFNAFDKYHRESAWVWEVQALIKARVIAGKNHKLTQAFQLLRTDILLQNRDESYLQEEIRAMRKKMLVLDQSTTTQFDIKYGRGGIVDLEFLVQYLVLRWANQYSSLLKWTDNIRLLEVLGKENLLKSNETESLKSAYLVLRETSHQRARQRQDNYLQNTEFMQERELIIKLWNNFLNDTVVVKKS